MDFSHGPNLSGHNDRFIITLQSIIFRQNTKVVKDRKIHLAHGSFGLRVAKEAAGGDHRNIKDLRKLLATYN